MQRAVEVDTIFISVEKDKISPYDKMGSNLNVKLIREI